MDDCKCHLISTVVASSLIGGQLHTSAVLESETEPGGWVAPGDNLELAEKGTNLLKKIQNILT